MQSALNLEHALPQIKVAKIAEAADPSSSPRISGNICLVESGRIKWIQPSGAQRLPPPPSSHLLLRISTLRSYCIAPAVGLVFVRFGGALSYIWEDWSGPRKPGEGTEDDEQGIVSAEELPSG
jgi:hypothetical protein